MLASSERTHGDLFSAVTTQGTCQRPCPVPIELDPDPEPGFHDSVDGERPPRSAVEHDPNAGARLAERGDRRHGG
jgi:hypothetical protein